MPNGISDFTRCCRANIPISVVLPAREGRDDSEQNRALTAALLREHPDLIGLYNAGAGNEGIAAVLEARRPGARHRLDRA